jgi:hypothetical protein
MKFLSVGADAKQVDHFNHFIKSDDTICFVIFHSPECHFCVETMPQWEKISSELGNRLKHNDKIMVADIDASAVSKTPFEDLVQGLPTILCISEKGKKVEPIEKANLKNDYRTVDSFVEWIELKSPSIYYSKNHAKEHKDTPYPRDKTQSRSRTRSRSRSRSRSRNRRQRGGKRSRKLRLRPRK